jgi:uncharacterized phage protein (TIGR01671 family)
MREYLFRGKRINNGEWVEGGIISLDADSGYVFIAEPFLSASTLPVYEIVKHHTHLVVPESVGQYTGMKDKNGRKIFEGDIINCWSEGVNAQGTVQQRKDGLWIIYPAWQKHIMWGLCPDEYSNTTVEVIGNVFDNADLLEG